MLDEYRANLARQTAAARNDPRTTADLINLALTEMDENAAWDAVVLLHFRGTRDVFDAAKSLCASDCPQEKTLGANILGQLGVPDRSFPDECVAVLTKLLKPESADCVLEAACIALGHLHGEELSGRAVELLCNLKDHADAGVRYAVAFALAGLSDNLTIKTLIELSSDEDPIVRDWATFALGAQTDADTPEIQQALCARLSDSDEITRGEALAGLARRKDERVVEPLIKELSSHHEAEHGSYRLEAAEQLADPRLLPVLLQLKESALGRDEELEKVIRIIHFSASGSTTTARSNP